MADKKATANQSEATRNSVVSGIAMADRFSEVEASIKGLSLRNEICYEILENMSSGVALYVVRDDGESFELVDINGAAERILNVRRGDLVGKPISTTAPPAADRCPMEMLLRVWKTGVPEHDPALSCMSKSGERWRENWVYKLSSGEVVNIFEDITDRVEANYAVRDSEERLQLLSSLSIEGIAVHENGVIIDLNPAFARMFGYDYEELLGMNVMNLAAPESRDMVLGRMEGGVMGTYEAVGLRKDGSRFTGELSIRSVRYLNRECRFVSIHDITERKSIEECLRRSERILMARSKIANAFLTKEGDELYDSVLQLVLESVGSELGIFGYIDERETLVCPSLTDVVWNQCAVPNKEIRYPKELWGDTLWGRALRQRKPLVSNEKFVVPGGHLPVRRCVAVPIVFGDKAIGLLMLANKETDYLQEDVEILELTCQTIAPILHAKLISDRGDHERRRADEALRESEAKYRLLYSSMSEGVMLGNLVYDVRGTTVDYRVNDVNAAFEKITGLRRNDCMGVVASRLFDIGRAPELHMITEVVATGRPACFESYSPEIDKHFRISVSSPAKGRFAAILADITEMKRAIQALRESEERYHDLFNSVMEGIGVVDETEVFQFCNPALAWVLDEESVNDVIGKRLLEYVPESSHKFLEAELERRTRGGPSKYELEIITAKAARKTIFVSISPRLNEKGDYIGAFGAMVDITERKNYEERLRTSEEKYRRLVDNLNIGIAMISPDMEILSLNRRMQEWFPNIDTALAHKCYECFNEPPRDDVCVYCPVVKTLRDGRVREAFTETPMGSVTRNFRIVSSPIFDKDGAVTAVIEMVEDVTEIRAAEQKIRELSLAVEQSPVAVVITDTTGKINYVNPKFSEITGYSASDVENRHLDFLRGDKSPEKSHQDFWDSVSSGHEWRGELQSRRNDGETFWESVSVSPLRDDEGRISHFIVMKEDISERKQAEEDRRELERKLQESSKLEAVGSLAAGIAHEINTPIQFVGDNTHYLSDAFDSMTELMYRYRDIWQRSRQEDHEQLRSEWQTAEKDADLEYISEEVPRAISQTLDGVKRVAEIVRSMKEFAHQGQKEMTVSDVNRMLESTITVARNELKYVADLATDFDPELPHITCQRNEINQVFLNLLINAAHAIADVVGDGGQGKGTITVRTRRDDDYVIISVGDTGSGIPEEIRDRVFNPFFTTKDVGKGTGQGLALAQSVVDKHNGTITFDSKTGEGTTFHIRLPVGSGQSLEELGQSGGLS